MSIPDEDQLRDMKVFRFGTREASVELAGVSWKERLDDVLTYFAAYITESVGQIVEAVFDGGSWGVTELKVGASFGSRRVLVDD